MNSELIVKNGVAYQLNRPYTGEGWQVTTMYKDHISSVYFSAQTAAELYAERYFNNTGDVALIKKHTFADGKRK